MTSDLIFAAWFAAYLFGAGVIGGLMWQVAEDFGDAAFGGLIWPIIAVAAIGVALIFGPLWLGVWVANAIKRGVRRA